MATVNKDFKIKSGLIVEGTTGTINGNDILTKKQADQDYIVNLIGGTATSQNTPDTVVKRDSNGNFAAGTITADLDGTAAYVDSLSGHTTTEISEGNNLYFTNQRAVDAQFGLWDTAGSAADAQDAAENYADGLISTEVTNRNNAIATAKSEAISSSNGYTDSAISTEVTNRNSAISTAKSEAISSSNGYTDDAISQEVSDRNSAISTAIYNLNLSGTYDALGAADQALSDANAYTDGEIAALVDSAPALLDTLNELAAAIADNPNYATDVANLVATKADTTYVDSEISDLNTAAQGYATTAENNAKSYADSLASNYDAAGAATTAYNNAVSYTDGEISSLDGAAQQYASTAEQNAKNYADGLAVNYDAAGAADAAETASNIYTDNAINGLTTSDIEEGSNLYFTDGRAKTSAADLLTGATLSNITITGNGSGLTITAENGVAQSTTDDLTEGVNNLYFQDSRVLDAVNNSTITPTAVSINDYRKEEATQQYVATASTVDVHALAYPYESAKYLVRVVGWDGGTKHSQITEILVTTDGNDNIAITEYGNVHTSTNPLATFSARLDQTGSTQYVLTATTAVNGCEIIAAATMLSWAD
jgi:hypothetical protein